MKLIPSGDWACLCDLDTCFLTPDAGSILEGYTQAYPDTGIFTCYTNRLHPSAIDQLYNGAVSEDYNIQSHKTRAVTLKDNLFKVTEINHEISGFLMMISKDTWSQIKFRETGKCLGIDNQYSWDVLKSGKKILRMDSLYVWHSYRIGDLRNKQHLL